MIAYKSQLLKTAQTGLLHVLWNLFKKSFSTVEYREESVGVFNPPNPEIRKTLQNRAKPNPIVKTVKNC